MGIRLQNTVFHPSSSGLVFALLGLAALASALTVAGFMTAAIRNARLATEQRLSALYRGHLQSTEEALDRFWIQRSRELETRARLGGTSAFAEIVRSGLADSALLFRTNGEIAYPNASSAETGPHPEEPLDWNRAQRTEFQQRDAAQAGTLYAKIAAESLSEPWRARALLARARCELKAGQGEVALQTLAILAGDPALAQTLDEHGNRIVPAAQLEMLQKTTDADVVEPLVLQLSQQLNEYGDTRLSAEQRLFLMEQTMELFPGVAFPTLSAERFAADFLSLPGSVSTERGLHLSRPPDLWTYGVPEARLVALYRTDTILQGLRPFLDQLALPGTQITLHPPRDHLVEEGRLPAHPAGSMMQGWRLRLGFPGSDPFAEAYRKEQRIYVGTGLLAVSLIGLFAFAIARLLQARLRLVRLQKDLVSNVTHELRTPVASIQALTESLRTHHKRRPEKTERYLDLLARESTRLGEVIDHFLNFSRMEQGGHPLRAESVSLEEVIASSVAQVRHHFEGTDAHLEVEVEPGLPAICGDRELLQTVVRNLLDNAWKYTGATKRLRVHARRRGDRLCLVVEDNGIGLTPTQARRVFDRFYQAETGLTRSRGGCGLGLSIVRWIVEAHGGNVSVESEPGKGSRFIALFPIQESRSPAPGVTNQTPA